MNWRAGLAITAVGLLIAGCAQAETSLETPLTAIPGDAARGREVLRDGSKATCLICHSISALPDRDQGMLGPNLDKAGQAYTAGELRLRLVDARKLNPETIMPPYFSTEGLNSVGKRWQGSTIYSAQEVEDVLAYLQRLRG